MKKTLAKISAGVLTVSASVTQAFAQSGLDWIGRIDTVSGTLDSWVINVLNFVIGLAALVAVGMLIAAGYLYITAGGDEGKVEKATKTLTFAIIGLVVCFIAVILVQFVLTNVLK
jgi:hypothetical protein